MGQPSRYNKLKKGYTCVAMIPQEGMSLGTDEKGRIHATYSTGWSVELTNQQWQDLYRDGTICLCGMCLSCGVREITEELINERDDVSQMLDPDVGALLMELLRRKDKQ